MANTSLCPKRKQSYLPFSSWSTWKAVQGLALQALAHSSIVFLPPSTGQGGLFQPAPRQPPSPTDTTYLPSTCKAGAGLLFLGGGGGLTLGAAAGFLAGGGCSLALGAGLGFSASTGFSLGFSFGFSGAGFSFGFSGAGFSFGFGFSSFGLSF